MTEDELYEVNGGWGRSGKSGSSSGKSGSSTPTSTPISVPSNSGKSGGNSNNSGNSTGKSTGKGSTPSINGYQGTNSQGQPTQTTTIRITIGK